MQALRTGQFSGITKKSLQLMDGVKICITVAMCCNLCIPKLKTKGRNRLECTLDEDNDCLTCKCE